MINYGLQINTPLADLQVYARSLTYCEDTNP